MHIPCLFPRIMGLAGQTASGRGPGFHSFHPSCSAVLFRRRSLGLADKLMGLFVDPSEVQIIAEGAGYILYRKGRNVPV